MADNFVQHVREPQLWTPDPIGRSPVENLHVRPSTLADRRHRAKPARKVVAQQRRLVSPPVRSASWVRAKIKVFEMIVSKLKRQASSLPGSEIAEQASEASDQLKEFEKELMDMTARLELAIKLYVKKTADEEMPARFARKQ